MSLVVEKRQVGDVTILDLSGRITLGEGASTLRDSFRAIASEGPKKILLNLAGVSYIDSSGLGLLVSGFTTLTNQGGQLKLLNLMARVKDLLLITKLYTVFEVFDNEKSALHSFEGAPVGQPPA
jgi:anti-sigma B factor antagonist